MPTLRSPVSGSLVTTHGKVRKRPASRGQHLSTGIFATVGHGGTAPRSSSKLNALGQASDRVAGASNFTTTSLQGPLLTRRGRAWRSSSTVPRSLSPSLKLVGGLALMSAPNSAATASTELAPKASAIRFQDP